MFLTCERYRKMKDYRFWRGGGSQDTNIQLKKQDRKWERKKTRNIKIPRGIYDRLAFSPTGLSQFRIGSLPISLILEKGVRLPQKGQHISTFLHLALIS